MILQTRMKHIIDAKNIFFAIHSKFPAATSAHHQKRFTVSQRQLEKGKFKKIKQNVFLTILMIANITVAASHDTHSTIQQPTYYPTTSPTTQQPSQYPTVSPTLVPSTLPTYYPTTSPTTQQPSQYPTVSPTLVPSTLPTYYPTTSPTTQQPSQYPTVSPTLVPSTLPTYYPTTSPTTQQPSQLPDRQSNLSTVNITNILPYRITNILH